MIHAIGDVRPKVQAVFSGDSTLIECHSYTPVTWTRNGILIKSESEVSIDHHLEFENVTEKESGNYSCRGTRNIYGDSFEATAVILVGGMY